MYLKFRIKKYWIDIKDWIKIIFDLSIYDNTGKYCPTWDEIVRHNMSNYKFDFNTKSPYTIKLGKIYLSCITELWWGNDILGLGNRRSSSLLTKLKLRKKYIEEYRELLKNKNRKKKKNIG